MDLRALKLIVPCDLRVAVDAFGEVCIVAMHEEDGLGAVSALRPRDGADKSIDARKHFLTDEREVFRRINIGPARPFDVSDLVRGRN